MNVFRLGMKQFAENELFIQAFVNYLVGIQQVDLAIQLLEQSIERMTGDDKARLWERLIAINARYKLTQPIDSILSLQSSYNHSNPSNKSVPGVIDISRYLQWGVRKVY